MADPEDFGRYAFGPFVLLPGQRQLLGENGEPVPLRGRVYDLLLLLIENRGRVVEKSELLEALWPNTVVEENNLNQTVSALRQALGDDPRAPRYVATIKGRGYQFVGEVRRNGIRRDSGEESARSAAPRRHPMLPLLLAAAAAFVVVLVVWTQEPDRVPPPPASAPIVESFADATVRLVTTAPGSHTAPTLSPDGRMIAYLSDADGTPQLFVKNLERGDPLRITDMEYNVGHPSWSPDDDEILFHEATPDGVSIYSVGTLGTPKPRRIIESGYGPSFAARSDAFVYARDKEIWLAQNDGREIERVVGVPKKQGFAAPMPALSPDGTQIAFVLADEGPLGNLWLIPSAGGEARQLTQFGTSGGYAAEPAWSPDGRFIVYTADDLSGGSHLWRVEVATGDAERLTTGAGGANQAVISADGTRLAFTTVRTRFLLTRIDLSSGERTDVFESRQPIALPDFSRDGDRLVYFSNAEAGGQVFMVGTDGTGLEQLTFDEGVLNILPTWAGDGESIFYYADRSLHRLSPETGDDERVFADFHWSSRNWLDAHDDKITYHKINRPTGDKETVVRSLGESDEVELAVPIEAAEWSPGGTELVGFFRKTGEIMVCRPGDATCRSIESDGSPVTGTRPTWSADGERIYYLRQNVDGKCCDLWRIELDGTDNIKLVGLEGFSARDNNYAVRDGAVFYNHTDNGHEEVWLAVLDDASSETIAGAR